MHGTSINKMREVLGKEFSTKTSGSCFVVDYVNNRNVIVIFHDPLYVTSCELGDLRKGKVKNPLYPTVYGKGYLGIGKYSTKNKEVYSLWMSMLKRSYSDQFKTRCPTYEKVLVCEEWHNFQNFSEWCYDQKFFNAKDDKGGTYHLDKDGLVLGNKIYSPETCCFVPREINNVWVDYVKNSNKLTTGVLRSEDGRKFLARIMIQRKLIHLGYYNTKDEAVFSYITAKNAYVKALAEKWKGKIDDKVYEILVNMDFAFKNY